METAKLRLEEDLQVFRAGFEPSCCSLSLSAHPARSATFSSRELANGSNSLGCSNPREFHQALWSYNSAKTIIKLPSNEKLNPCPGTRSVAKLSGPYSIQLLVHIWEQRSSAAATCKGGRRRRKPFPKAAATHAATYLEGPLRVPIWNQGPKTIHGMVSGT